MSKKKTETKQTQNTNFNNTNTYDWMTPPESADIQAVRDFQFTADPRIGYTYGNARNQAANSFNNPIGGMYSPQIRDQIMRSQLSDLSQQESQAYSEANQGLQSQRFGQRAAVAAMTAPRMVQTGSSGTGSQTGNTTQTQSGGLLEAMLISGMSGASQGAVA